MENQQLRQEIDALIAELGDDLTVARPAAERDVMEKIRRLLDETRDSRTHAAREIWEAYLPYAAGRCYRLSRLEEGWEEDVEYFASENAQFWVDNAASLLDRGDISGSRAALEQIVEAARMARRDRIAQVDILLQALEYALEIGDRKLCARLYEEAEKIHRKHLAGGGEYTGSAWLPKIKRMEQRLNQYGEKMRRYYQYAPTVTVTMEADSESELVRVIEHLQQSLPGKVTVTRRAKAEGADGTTGGGRSRARVKFTLE